MNYDVASFSSWSGSICIFKMGIMRVKGVATTIVSFQWWTTWPGVDRLGITYFPHRQGPRFSHGWLKMSSSPGYPTMIGWMMSGQVHQKSSARTVTHMSTILALGPLHTQDWGPVAIALQALSLVEKKEPVQVHFTLRLRDQRSKWVQDGCKVYMESCMAANESCFMVTWVIFIIHLLEVGLTLNQETMVLRNLTTIDLLYFYHVSGPQMNKNSSKLHLVEDLVKYDFTLHLRAHDHTMWFWECLGTIFGTFLLGSHNFMITALGLCVKWPLGNSTLEIPWDLG